MNLTKMWTWIGSVFLTFSVPIFLNSSLVMQSTVDIYCLLPIYICLQFLSSNFIFLPFICITFIWSLILSCYWIYGFSRNMTLTFTKYLRNFLLLDLLKRGKWLKCHAQHTCIIIMCYVPTSNAHSLSGRFLFLLNERLPSAISFAVSGAEGATAPWSCFVASQCDLLFIVRTHLCATGGAGLRLLEIRWTKNDLH